jgi:hypothetical protein
MSSLRKQTGKDAQEAAEAALKPSQAVDVAMVVYTTMSSVAGVPQQVWSILQTPWPGFEINADVKSVEINMQALKETARKTILNEEKGSGSGIDINGGDSKTDQKAGGGNGSAQSTGAEASKSNSTGVWNSIKNTASGAWESVKKFTSGIFGGNSASTLPGAGSGTGGGMGGGAAITHPGNGSGGDVNSLPLPTGSGKWEHMKDLILGAAKMVGVDGGLMATMAALESGFQPGVKAGTSSATGLYQFISSTWKTMLKRYGAKYGISPDASPTDPRANALMGAEYIRENADYLKPHVGRPLTDTDLYIAHFLGAGGARKFLTADPNAIAADMLPAAAAANKPIFYKDGRALTVGEVYQVINGRVRRKGAQYGLGQGGPAITEPNPGTAGKPNPAATPSAVGAEKLGSRDPMSIPVSDQTPGTPAPQGAAMLGSRDPMSKQQSPKEVVAAGVAAAGAGFQPATAPQASTRSADLNAQAAAQQSDLAKLLVRGNDIDEQHLSVANQQLAVLTKLLEIAQAGGNASASAPQDSSRSGKGPARSMTTAPVSMSKS